jgi:hypothetical protein
MLVERELGVERGAHGGDRAGEHDRTARRADLDDVQAVLGGELLEPLDVGGIGAVALGERRAVDRLGRLVAAAPAQRDRDLDAAAGIGLADAAGVREGGALAAVYGNPGRHGKTLPHFS